MAQTKQTSTQTATSTASTTAAPRRTVRKPPVIERAGVNALETPATTAPAVSPPAPSPPAAAGGAQATTTTTTAAGAASTASGSSSGTTSTDFPVNSPPVVQVPPVPAGFVPVNALDLRGFRPMQSELASVPDAILELSNFANYTGIFGITAPPSSQVSQRLTVAAQWTSLYSASTAWFTYVKSQEGMAWKDALELVEKLKAPFQLASASNPALLSKYPALARMLGAQKVVAKRAVSARVKNQTPAAAAALAAATAPAATPPVAPAAPAVPARVVTVQG